MYRMFQNNDDSFIWLGTWGDLHRLVQDIPLNYVQWRPFKNYVQWTIMLSEPYGKIQANYVVHGSPMRDPAADLWGCLVPGTNVCPCQIG
jgi:hypothetical protein